jgi:hypothetical protein
MAVIPPFQFIGIFLAECCKLSLQQKEAAEKRILSHLLVPCHYVSKYS